MPAFSLADFSWTSLTYWALHPITFLLVGIVLLGSVILAVIQASAPDVDPDQSPVAEDVNDLIRSYSPRSFSRPAPKGIDKTNVVDLRARRDRKDGAA